MAWLNLYIKFYKVRGTSVQFSSIVAEKSKLQYMESVSSTSLQCMYHSKWFKSRSISSSYGVIVRVRVVLKRTVVGVTNNSSFQNYPHPDDHTIRTNILIYVCDCAHLCLGLYLFC